MNLICPLCRGEKHALFYEDRLRPYYRCARCALVFVPPSFHLTAEEEKGRYDLHENNPDDAGYCRFLCQLRDPMLAKLQLGARGLDYGCGPGPTLSGLFEEAGLECSNYDPFYCAEPQVLEQVYDFVSCSEVIEHCYDPQRVLEQLFALTRIGGVVGIMTQWVRDQQAFAQWRYIDDETHVCFFSKETFGWVAAHYDLPVEFVGKSVTLFAI